METTLRETERTYVRLIVGALVIVVSLVLLGWGGARLYHSWQLRSALQRATTLLSAGNLRAASLSARRAYQLNPRSPAAARLLAQIAREAGERTELDWRRAVVRANPGLALDQIALADCALRFDDLGTAERALAAVGASSRSADYHAVGARLAQARQQPAEAREQWAEAVRLAPNDKSYQVHLDAAILPGADVAARERALAQLEQFRQDPSERAAATRVLLVDGTNHGRNPTEVLKLARDLQGYPESTFDDALLYLDVLRRQQVPDFAPHLEEIEQRAVKNPEDLARLISWMNRNALAPEALRFAGSLNSELLARWPVPLARADSYLVANDWPGLERWLAVHPWGTLEFLRHAYLARAFREQGQTVAAEREWSAAKKEAARQTKTLSVLQRTVSGWQWKAESEELLWKLTKDATTRNDALRSLYRQYAAQGDTSGLYRALVRLVELMPGDLALQNNLAQVSLLLGADLTSARRIAADLHRKKPEDPAFVSTYAFSLFANGDAGGALKAMGALGEDRLRTPALAVYYGIFLASAGQPEKARKYLALAAAAQLLPEEKALVAKAEEKAR